jgi:hypothetical protein
MAAVSVAPQPNTAAAGSMPKKEPAQPVYIEALRDPARIHAICEEYQAAAIGSANGLPMTA